MASKPKRTKSTGHTAPEVHGVPLSWLARSLANTLRAYRGDPSQLPDNLRDEEGRKLWMMVRSRERHVPALVLDLAVAVLEAAIPVFPEQRTPRRPGKRPDPALTEIAEMMTCLPVATRARLVARREAYKREQAGGEPYDDDAVEQRAQRLMRQVYRKRKRRP